MLRVCIVPGKLQGIGGPASFQRKLAVGLAERGIQVTYDLDDDPYDAVLVINGTRQLAKLWRCKKRGIRIVQRLGGINWLHKSLHPGSRWYLVEEIRNLIMAFIRRFLASHVVYQSQFVKKRWENRYGVTKVPSKVIYNGVDLVQFTPEGDGYRTEADVCILSVEGTQGFDPYNISVGLARGIAARGISVELLVLGRIDMNWGKFHRILPVHDFVKHKGPVPNKTLPFYYRGSDLYISTDINAACPNAVIEALGCGLPVLGYATGALPELVSPPAGRCVEYGSDPWRGEPPPNRDGLVNAAIELLANLALFRCGARGLAEERYGLGRMVDAYIEMLLGRAHT